ncbi:MAG: acyltransferase [Bacilli bacterium]|nr:acyltransferase [Bacilli bacterium]
MNTKRVAAIDIGKFIAILFIILTHVLQRTIPGYTDTWGSVYILLLGVPVFFFLSGMSYRYKEHLKPIGFLYDILKRGFAYLLPFILFLLFRVLVNKQWPDFATAFNECMNYPVMGLWVLWILLWISIVVDIGLLISSVKPKLKVVFVPAVLIVGLVTLIILRNNGVITTDSSIGYNYFVTYIPVFIVGYLFGNLSLKIKNKFVLISFIAVGLAGLFPVSIFNMNIIKVTFLSSVGMIYVGSLCAILFYIGIINLLKCLKMSDLLGFCGRFTLEAYMIHLILLKNWNGLALSNNAQIFGMTIGLFLLCIVTIAGVVAVTYFVPFLHFLVFGRHFSFYEFENKFFDKIKNVCYQHGHKNK